MQPPRVLLVANRTASDQPLAQAVRQRALTGPALFHLLVPATPQGLHRLVDPEVAGVEAATARLRAALPVLSEAAGQAVTGHVGDANPLAAISDALHLRGFDEILLSTVPWRLSRWLRADLPSKVRALGPPVLHVTGDARPRAVPRSRLSRRPRGWVAGGRERSPEPWMTRGRIQGGAQPALEPEVQE